MHALAARPEVHSFSLVLPSPVTEGDLGELLGVLGTKLTSLEVQQVRWAWLRAQKRELQGCWREVRWMRTSCHSPGVDSCLTS